MVARIVTDQMAADFACRYRAGETMPAIAARYGLTTQAVHKWLKRLDVPRRPSGPSPAAQAAYRERLDGAKEQLVADFEAGMSMQRIRARAGLSYPVVRQLLGEAGIDDDRIQSRAQQRARLYSETEWVEWRRRHEQQGATLSGLAREYFCSDQTIRRGIISAGGRPRTAGAAQITGGNW